MGGRWWRYARAMRTLKEIAVLEGTSLAQLVALAPSLGYAIANPESGLVHGFPAKGATCTFSPEQLDGFLHEGAGVLLWRHDGSRNVFVRVRTGEPHVSLAALAQADRDALLQGLRELGVQVRLGGGASPVRD